MGQKGNIRPLPVQNKRRLLKLYTTHSRAATILQRRDQLKASGGNHFLKAKHERQQSSLDAKQSLE